MKQTANYLKELFRRAFEKFWPIFVLGIFSAVTGVLVGAIDAGFGLVLLSITSFRQLYFIFLIPFLALAGMLIQYVYKRDGTNSSKGMTLVFEAGHGELEQIPKRMIPLAIISTWLTHLFGGSAGREGVAVQIGATVGNFFGKRLPIRNAARILLVTGMAAGFAGLFRTPIAAVLFAVEVLTAGEIIHEALFPSLIAAYLASYTSGLLGLEKFTVNLTDTLHFSISSSWKIVVLGIVFGAAGGIFAFLLHKAKHLLAKWIGDPIRRIAVTGVFVSILSIICFMGRYSGLGTNLITESFSGGTINGYDWLLKLILTILTLAAGFQGGEVTPLFAIGASLGVVLAVPLGLPVLLTAALGYAAVFGSATNTYFAPIFIGAEVFGYDYLPLFFTVCTVAYMINGNRSIYPLQKTRKMTPAAKKK